MKKIFTLSAFSLMALAAQAQISLDQSGYASWTPGTSSFKGVTNFTATPANNGSWDLSTATYGTTFTTTRFATTIPGLSQVTFGEDMYYSFGSFGYSNIIGGAITAAGYQRFGENMARQAFGLGTLTGNTNDSLVFNQQVVTYSAPRTMIAFPATTGSTWSSNYNYHTGFAITVAMYSLNNTPGERRTYVERADSVKGWGQMRVKDASGHATGYMDVLAVETSVKVKDSFYLAGSPAPAPMLSAFGLSQGQIENTYYTYYYRAGEIDPVLTIEYDNASRSNIVSSYTHTDRLPSDVKNMALSGDIKLYPNPSANGDITLYAQELNSGSWTYEVMNIAGQIIAVGHLQANNGNATLHISNYAQGLHYLSLHKDGVVQATKTLVLQ